MPIGKTEPAKTLNDTVQKNQIDSSLSRTIADNSTTNTTTSANASSENIISASRNIVPGNSNTEFKIIHLIKNRI